MDDIKTSVQLACKQLFGVEIDANLERTEEKFGDYSTNVAMRLAKQVGQNPLQIAEKICEKLTSSNNFKCEVAKPGFINFRLSSDYWDESFKLALKAGENFGESGLYDGKKIVVEYSDPNPFKALHAGHLYTSIVGDAIANLFENAGAKVYRVNFGGDVGLHVAKTIYAVIKELDGENPDKLEQTAGVDKAGWLSKMYVSGNEAYKGKAAESDIKDLNKKLYAISQRKDNKSPLGKIYWTTRQWSYDYFDNFYKRIGTHFDKYYPESETGLAGMALISEGIKAGVFTRSEGAVVFEAEKYDLHTRVFINKEGLPTYETKDLGLMKAKKHDFSPNLSVVITGNEQAEYMKVVIKAMEQLDAATALATRHITHGLVKLAGGRKMSSRSGNVLGAEDVIKSAEGANEALNGKPEPSVALAAVKYSFLKQRLGTDIIFNPEESVSLVGNSGPYIQYSYARASSITSKSTGNAVASTKLEEDELGLAKKLLEFSDILDKATKEMHPHHICNYLFELAGEFNRFYENNRVIGDERQATRLNLINLYKSTVKKGLDLLGMPAPEKLARAS